MPERSLSSLLVTLTVGLVLSSFLFCLLEVNWDVNIPLWFLSSLLMIPVVATVLASLTSHEGQDGFWLGGFTYLEILVVGFIYLSVYRPRMIGDLRETEAHPFLLLIFGIGLLSSILSWGVAIVTHSLKQSH